MKFLLLRSGPNISPRMARTELDCTEEAGVVVMRDWTGSPLVMCPKESIPRLIAAGIIEPI